MNITGIILAGGKSSRMGSDKGLLNLNGLLFIERVIKALKPLVKDIIIVSNNSDYDKFGYKRVTDIIKDSGPLAGLYTGLSYSDTENNIVLSCDIPLIKTLVLEQLLNPIYSDFDVVQLQSKNKTMPLIATYKKACEHTCLELLNNGERRLREVANQLVTKTITIDSSLELYVENINTIHQLNHINNDVEY